MPETVHHTYAPQMGGVKVKVERNSRSVNVEVQIDRPRQDGESFEDAAMAAVSLAKRAYERAREEFPQPPEAGK